MPQSPLSDLVITNAGTIIRQVDTVQFTGDGVTITPGTPNPRVAVVNIPGGGGGTPTLAAGALLGNPGTISAPGTNVTVGLGLTLTSSGSLEAMGGAYLQLESGTVASKISAMPTLAVPPLAPFYLTGITNDGTTTANYQIPQGIVIQPSSNGTNSLGVHLQAGAIYNPGTPDQAYAAALTFGGGNIYISNPAGYGRGGSASGYGGGVGYDRAIAGGAGFFFEGGVFNAGSYIGGSALFKGGQGSPGGNLAIYSGAGQLGGDNGNIIINPQPNTGNGIVLVKNLGTADPHVLDAVWRYTNTLTSRSYLISSQG